MASLMDRKQRPIKERMSRIKAWSILLSCLALLYLFGVGPGPWLQHHIPGMDAIVRVMEEHDIDGGAYYYTEIEAAHVGQVYLNQSLQSMAPEHYGLTLPLVSTIAACLLMLYFGFRFLPR